MWPAVSSTQLIQIKYVQSATRENGFDLDGESRTSLAENINSSCQKRHSNNCEKGLLRSSCLSVRLSTRNNSAPTTRIVIIFHI